jgi:hypothetical protein
MVLASIPLAVGRVARSLIEEGLLSEGFVWVLQLEEEVLGIGCSAEITS